MSAPQSQTILDDLLSRAGDRPEAEAFGVEGETLTWAGLLEQTKRLAAALAERGVGPGERCALMLPTSLDLIAAIFAVQWTGAAPVIMDHNMSPDMAARRFRLVRPRVVLARPETSEAMGEKTAPEGAACADPRALIEESDSLETFEHRARPDAPAYLQLTSGTTGDPKAVVVSHRKLARYLPVFARALDLSEKDVLVAWLPVYHDFGLIGFTFTPVHLGSRCELMAPAIANFPRWLKTLDRLRGTVTGSPDFGLRLAHRRVAAEDVDLSHLRMVICGAEPIRPTTLRDFGGKFGAEHTLCPGYGQAEALLAVTMHPPGTPFHVDASGYVSNGRPLEGFELRVVDDTESDVPTGRAGKVYLRGPHLFDGYFEDPEATAQAFHGEWLDTGDDGYLDADGNLYILGRRRAMIKRAGAVIAPREIEEAAEQVPGIHKTAAIGAPEGKAGLTEKVVLLAEIKPENYPTIEERQELVELIYARIAESTGESSGDVVLVRPRSIEMTPNGKIRYPALRTRYVSGELERTGAVLFPEPAAQPRT